MLSPGSRGARNVREFLVEGALSRFWIGTRWIAPSIMDQYADHPMDLADASLLVAAERLDTRRVFTVDRRDFTVYRVRRRADRLVQHRTSVRHRTQHRRDIVSFHSRSGAQAATLGPR